MGTALAVMIVLGALVYIAFWVVGGGRCSACDSCEEPRKASCKRKRG